MNEQKMFSPEEKKDIEAERERVLRVAQEKADLKNEGLSLREKIFKGKETALGVLQQSAAAEDDDRDYSELMNHKAEREYPGSIEKMEKAIEEGVRFHMEAYLFAHRSAKTNEEKTKIYNLYESQKVTPFEGASRGKEAEMVGLQMAVRE